MIDRIHKPFGEDGKISRRRFLGTTAAAAAAFSMTPFSSFASPGRAMGMDINGVKVGAISYSFRELPSSAEEILGYLVQTGLDVVELMGGPAEQFAGAPEPPAWPRRGTQLTDAQRADLRSAREAYAEAARKWRLSASMDRFEALRKMYNDEGVHIDILKLGDPRWSDEEIDYAFRAAKAVGARGISFELSNEAAKRMGPFATKHQMFAAMHNHTQVGEADFSFDIPLTYSPYNMLNLDVGHYVAGTSESPIPIIQKYHDRITHLHLKDRKKGTNGGDNVPWGQGDTPLREVLQLLRKEQYPITAMIELEYPIPEGSDVLTEVRKCVEYCREALA
ncbi:MAG TPA: TIM barrel protein [Rhodothermales bacterium]|nr:TIM barrel protein [Rhodothermales bacterium]